jgi:hypothetical protein
MAFIEDSAPQKNVGKQFEHENFFAALASTNARRKTAIQREEKR